MEFQNIGIADGGVVHWLGDGFAHAQPRAIFADAEFGICASVWRDFGSRRHEHAVCGVAQNSSSACLDLAHRYCRVSFVSLVHPLMGLGAAKLGRHWLIGLAESSF
jgi:hypothetical protein